MADSKSNSTGSSGRRHVGKLLGILWPLALGAGTSALGDPAPVSPPAAGLFPESTLHSKIYSGLTFKSGAAESIVCVLDTSGLPYPDCDKLEQVLAMIPAERLKHIECPDMIVTELNAAEALLLASMGPVHSIVPDIKLHMALDDSVEIVHAVEAWNFGCGGFTGAGQTIAVIDTGSDFTHPALADKNIAGGNFDCSVAMDCPLDETLGDWHSHGTHICGICAATGPVVNGVARGANLVSIKVFPTNQGTIPSYLIKRGIRAAIDHADELDISVISMSLASDYAYTAPCDWINSPVRNAINDATAAGIAVVVAAGNLGAAGGTGYPACVTNAIGVGATGANDVVAPYSNYSHMMLLFAPGSGIYSTCLNGGYCTKTGTSMATPMVSAAIAILRQVLDSAGASMHPMEIEQLLYETGDPVLGVIGDQWSRINIEAAVMQLLDDLLTPADITRDGLVDVQDLLEVWTHWGPCPDDCTGDVNGDGTVDIDDVVEVVVAWGCSELAQG